MNRTRNVLALGFILGTATTIAGLVGFVLCLDSIDDLDDIPHNPSGWR